MRDLYEKLKSRLKNYNRIAFMGIGEEKLSDDGFGPYVISELLPNSNEKVLFINAATDPMARMEEVVNFNPSHLVLIDTCTLDKEPGTISLIEREDLKEYVPISSHTIPVHIVIDLITEKLPKLEVFMIGIVPKSLRGFVELKQYKEGKLSINDLNENIDLPFFEIKLSKEIKSIANELIRIIKRLI